MAPLLIPMTVCVREKRGNRKRCRKTKTERRELWWMKGKRGEYIQRQSLKKQDIWVIFEEKIGIYLIQNSGCKAEFSSQCNLSGDISPLQNATEWCSGAWSNSILFLGGGHLQSNLHFLQRTTKCSWDIGTWNNRRGRLLSSFTLDA